MWDESQLVGRVNTSEQKKEEKKEAVEVLKAKVEEILAETPEVEQKVTVVQTEEEAVEVIAEELKKEEVESVLIVKAEEKEEEVLAEPVIEAEPTVEPIETVEEVSVVDEEPVVASEPIAEPVAETVTPVVPEEVVAKKDELDPCPFCGKVVTLTYFKKWYVTGHETNCILSANFAVGKTKEQMANAWNSRAW